MSKKLIYLLSCYLAFFTTAVWSNPYYCANSGQLVVNGMSLDKVIQACGNPTKIETKEKQDAVDRQLQYQWVYSSNKNSAPWDKKVAPELTISFYQGFVTAIEVNGKAVEGGINCFGRGTIQINDSRDKVALICGKPDAYQRARKTIMGPEQTLVIATYERGNGLTPVIFEFEDNKVSAIRYGS